MTRVSPFLLLAGILSSPALGQSDPLAPLPAPNEPAKPAVRPQSQPPVESAPLRTQAQPVPVVPSVQIPRDWRGVFAAIRSGNWDGAQAGIATLPRSVLTPVALAELYTAKGSPIVSLQQVQALVGQAPDLPKAEQLARLAIARGASVAPAIAQPKPDVGLGSGPRRYRVKPVTGEPLADTLRSQLDPYIKADDAIDAERLVYAQAPMLSPEAQAEAWQRVAWAHYSIGQDLDAKRVADVGRSVSTGEWGAASAWLSGLASWRLNDCNGASAAFRQAAGTTQGELRAGALYWTARAEQACRRPQSVEPLLRAAATSPESFYGLLARETLGTETTIAKAPPAPLQSVQNLPNVARAEALVAIGEHWLAEDMLRYQARIGSPADQEALIGVAKKLGLAGAQYWLATNGQRGVRVYQSERYPMPAWTPAQGWQVDPALAYAHIIQESNFRADAVSPASAMGLMQITPITVRQHASSLNMDPRSVDLFNPMMNIAFGQQNLQMLRSSPATGGALPKMMAAYNAGLTPVSRWATIPDKGDPLLWIESIPYWETRYYVPAVMRNLWVYQGLENEHQESLTALAQHRWPGVPVNRGTRISSITQ
jgi:soluble lytic murein transglycosylase-like protein